MDKQLEKIINKYNLTNDDLFVFCKFFLLPCANHVKSGKKLTTRQIKHLKELLVEFADNFFSLANESNTHVGIFMLQHKIFLKSVCPSIMDSYFQSSLEILLAKDKLDNDELYQLGVCGKILLLKLRNS